VRPGAHRFTPRQRHRGTFPAAARPGHSAFAAAGTPGVGDSAGGDLHRERRAATFPMGPSVQAARAELVSQMNRYPRRIVLSGYSQGALVTGIAWRDDILDPSGKLHARLADVVAIINFGDPMRCPGIANGNTYAGQPLPKKLDGFTAGGIAGPGNLTRDQTPELLLSFANDGDLYACAPTGDHPWDHETEVGHDERIIFDTVQIPVRRRRRTLFTYLSDKRFRGL